MKKKIKMLSTLSLAVIMTLSALPVTTLSQPVDPSTQDVVTDDSYPLLTTERYNLDAEVVLNTQEAFVLTPQRLSNVSWTIPRDQIIAQEIVYLGGVPVLFESYLHDYSVVDIASLLAPTNDGYRVVPSDEELSRPLPRNFMDLVLVHHDEMRGLSFNAEADSEIGIEAHF